MFYSHGLQASAWRFWIEVQVGGSPHCCGHPSGTPLASGIVIPPSYSWRTKLIFSARSWKNGLKEWSRWPLLPTTFLGRIRSPPSWML